MIMENIDPENATFDLKINFCYRELPSHLTYLLNQEFKQVIVPTAFEVGTTDDYPVTPTMGRIYPHLDLHEYEGGEIAMNVYGAYRGITGQALSLVEVYEPKEYSHFFEPMVVGYRFVYQKDISLHRKKKMLDSMVLSGDDLKYYYESFQ
jgi:hypothetical protein